MSSGPGIAVPGSNVPASSLVGPGGAQGIQGPIAVSKNAGNEAVLGTDGLLYVPYGNAQDFGDLVAPSSPTVYDDEFTAATLDPKWTVSGVVAGVTCQPQPPTYLAQIINYQGAGTTSLGVSALQNLTAPALSTSWLFQFKLRWNMMPQQIGVASSNTYQQWWIGFAKTTATTKGFWLYGTAANFQGAAGTQYFMYPMQLQLARGVGAGVNLNITSMMSTGVDLRVQMGVQGANLVCNVSVDGYTWVTIYSEAYSTGTTFAGLVPNQLQIGYGNGGGGANALLGSGYAAWDYVRCLHL